MIVVDVRRQEAAQMTLVEDHNVIQVLAANRIDNALGIWVGLPGWSWRRDDLSDAHRLGPLAEVHFPNQSANLAIYRLPPGSWVPTPIEPKPLTVPLNDGGGLDQDHGVQTARPYSVQPNPEQAVDREQPGPTRALAIKNVQLMMQSEVL
jgi:hypothetical protein